MSNKKYDRMKKEDSMSMNQINAKRLNQQDNKKSLNTINVIIHYIFTEKTLCSAIFWEY
jgi:hypothetical protein